MRYSCASEKSAAMPPLSASEDFRSRPKGFSTITRVQPPADMHDSRMFAHTGGYTEGGSAR